MEDKKRVLNMDTVLFVMKTFTSDGKNNIFQVFGLIVDHIDDLREESRVEFVEIFFLICGLRRGLWFELASSHDAEEYRKLCGEWVKVVIRCLDNGISSRDIAERIDHILCDCTGREDKVAIFAVILAIGLCLYDGSVCEVTEERFEDFLELLSAESVS
jgi:hypothetical protein